jgi:putative intracellular protease/amidase
MTTILTLLTPNFADWEFAMIGAVARGYCRIDVRTASPDGAPVVSLGGLKAMPDMAINDVDLLRVDALVVIGGPTWEEANAPDVRDLLRAAHWNGSLIGAICGGTRALASTGLLDHVAHTSNARDYLLDVPFYRGAGHYRDSSSAIRSGRIITAPGTAPVSFMKEVIGALGKGSADLDFYAELFGAEHEAMRIAA